MSDSVTPPRPTAPTAAELRDSVRRGLHHHSCEGECDCGRYRHVIDDQLGALVAAVRAEALEEAATLVEIYVGSARAARVPRAVPYLKASLAAAEARAEKAEGEVRYLRERRKWEVATLSPSSPLSVSCQAAVVAGQEGDCASCRGWLAVSPAPQPPEGVAP